MTKVIDEARKTGKDGVIGELINKMPNSIPDVFIEYVESVNPKQGIIFTPTRRY